MSPTLVESAATVLSPALPAAWFAASLAASAAALSAVASLILETQASDCSPSSRVDLPLGANLKAVSAAAGPSLTDADGS